MDKVSARRLALESRRTIDVKVISSLVVSSIVSSNILSRFNNIGIYYPLGREIDVMELVNMFPDKSFYLPITRAEIDFIEYKAGDVLVGGPFKTKEPIGKIVKRETLDCVIIPCVAISRDNKRVGYGKGYYDRYLAGYKGFKIGIAYQNSVNMDISMDEFDVVLDMKFTG